ncbi:hypothetical protein [Brucella suis]|nr:hypothetical protein [Brucella suis]
MMVALIDQGDANLGPVEITDQLQPAKTGTDDDDMGAVGCIHLKNTCF